ncbi:hypothetical protein LTR62_004401 [Meristemomyces frigidus]|uniref:NmrA-like domain-containing protein n=1 Tax=Meristemomyces frigidus TaxID=1508187 RepID=A0AAN7THN6_9PEZI|nr:hypothetical protein LTR62_004401 [Meristemomyces frigidus]
MPANLEDDLLLITAASGKQAAGLLPHLHEWSHLRLQVNSQDSADRMSKAYPEAEIVQANLASQADCARIMVGVATCYLITPSFHPHEAECGYHIIDAARSQFKTGVFKHLVHSSVLHPSIRKLMNHDNKRYVEEYLIESGLPYTILQPTHLMETLDVKRLMTAEKAVHRMLWSSKTMFSFVSTRDAGEAAAKVLREREKHLYATYELVSTATPLCYDEVRVILSEELGKEVSLERVSVEEGAEMFAKMITKGQIEGAEFENRQGPARLFLYYNQKGLIGNSNVLEMLLGRKPLGYREWVRVHVAEVKV